MEVFGTTLFKCQEEAWGELSSLLSYDRHSILIVGPEGCGKTKLARLYAQLSGIDDFAIVEPNVGAIRDAVDGTYNLTNKMIFCIENLDKGVLGASYTLLKFLEEPAPNVYIIVTAQNQKKIPETIVSRSIVVNVSPPIDADIQQYAEAKDASNYQLLKSTTAWRIVKTLKDVDILYRLNYDQIMYFDSLQELFKAKDSISNMAWQMGHFPDGSETPIELILRYMITYTENEYLRKCGIDCVRDISSGRIAAHAALSKFLFELKYGG